jgi:hypothetical protein
MNVTRELGVCQFRNLINAAYQSWAAVTRMCGTGLLLSRVVRAGVEQPLLRTDPIFLILQEIFEMFRTSADAWERVAGGDGGIRTLDTLLGYAHLANECLQPLGHVSGRKNKNILGNLASHRWRNRREQGARVKLENAGLFQPSRQANATRSYGKNDAGSGTCTDLPSRAKNPSAAGLTKFRRAVACRPMSYFALYCRGPQGAGLLIWHS